MSSLITSKEKKSPLSNTGLSVFNTCELLSILALLYVMTVEIWGCVRMELSDWQRKVFLGLDERDKNKLVEKNNISKYQPFLKLSPPISFPFFLHVGLQELKASLTSQSCGWAGKVQRNSLPYNTTLMLG